MTSPYRWALTALLLSHLTDAYSWHFLDLLPGVGVDGALGSQWPVDLEGGRRGAPEASS